MTTERYVATKQKQIALLTSGNCTRLLEEVLLDLVQGNVEALGAAITNVAEED